MCASSALAVNNATQNSVHPSARRDAARRLGNNTTRQMSAHRAPTNAPDEFVMTSPTFVSRPGIQYWSVSTVIVVTNAIVNTRRRDIPASRIPIPNGMKSTTFSIASSTDVSPQSKQKLAGAFVAWCCGVSVSNAMNNRPPIHSARPNTLCGINATVRGARWNILCEQDRAKWCRRAGCYNIPHLRGDYGGWHPNCKTWSHECGQ